MITQCSYCRMDTAGNHEYGCPCRQVNFPDDRMDFEKQINFQMHEATGNKPQPQGAPTPLDILAVLSDFIPKINQICDQLHAKSLTLEDAYCEAGDKANAIFDLCGELQADYAKIVREEFQQEG